MQDKKIKVLLCTPFKTSNNNVSGISIWAHNIYDYYINSSSNFEIDILSQSTDNTFVSKTTPIFKRLLIGFKTYYKVFKSLKTCLTNNQYDIFHLCSSASISLVKDYLYIWYVKRYHVKAIIHFHFGRIPELAEKNNWEWKLLKKVVQLADCTIVMDSKSSNILTCNDINNVYNVPNPLASNIIDIIKSNENEIKRINNKILFAGHVIPTKGIYELLYACKTIDDIELHIVGKLLKEEKQRIEELFGSNSKWFYLRGEIPHEDVIKEMLSAGIFVLPTYTEGFPNVILESMACSCPIITTAVGAIPDMLNKNDLGECGICIEPKDIGQLHDSILKMLNNQEFAYQCGQKANKRVNQKYEVAKIWEQLSNIWIAISVNL